MVRANQFSDLASGMITNDRAAMAAHIVKRPRLASSVSRDNDGISIHFEREIVTGFWNFTSVPHKEPTRAPHRLAIEPVELLIGIKLPQQTMPAGLTGDQIPKAW